MDVIRQALESVPVWLSVGLIVLDFTIRIIALGVVPHNRRPSSAWGWLPAIYFIPLIGVFLYLLLGGSGLGKDRTNRQLETADRLKLPNPERATAGKPPEMPGWAMEAVRLNHDSGGMPLTGGNDVGINTDYDASLAAMEEEIRQAGAYVHFQFYIVAKDRTTEQLVNALVGTHHRGVAVRVLIDHLGSVGFPGYSEMVDRLNGEGIPWRRMLPVRPWRGEYQRPDIRNHRKMLVVDGKTVFTGSQNVIDRSYNKRKNRREHLKWKDIVLRPDPAQRPRLRQSKQPAAVQPAVLRCRAADHHRQSSNMDIRSFTLNLEVNLMVLGLEFMARMDQVVDEYEASSHALQLEEWLKRPLRQKYFDNVCRLTSGLQ